MHTHTHTHTHELHCATYNCSHAHLHMHAFMYVRRCLVTNNAKCMVHAGIRACVYLHAHARVRISAGYTRMSLNTRITSFKYPSRHLFLILTLVGVCVCFQVTIFLPSSPPHPLLPLPTPWRACVRTLSLRVPVGKQAKRKSVSCYHGWAVARRRLSSGGGAHANDHVHRHF